MRIPSSLLSGLRIGFTIAKSLALLIRRRAKVRNTAAILAYVVEVMLGLALSILLVLEAWTEAAPGVAALVLKISTLAILGAEILSSLVEGVLLWWRCRECALIASTQRRVVKNMARIVGFIAGGVALVFALADAIRTRRGLLRIVVLGSSAVVETLLATLATLATNHPRLRANFAIIASFVAAAASIASVVVERGTKRKRSLEPSAQTAVFAAALGSASTSATAWMVPDFAVTQCVDCDHARVFETVAVGVGAPILALALGRGHANTVRDIVLTVLPQAAVLVIPLLFGYIATLSAKPQVVNELEPYQKEEA